jgi:F-type H+-transporting ATPase subunit epsilon
MHLEILTPDKAVFSGRINSVSLPGTSSPFTILKNHAPIISTLDMGDIELETEQGVILMFSIDKGIVEARDNKIVVLIEKVNPVEKPQL